MEKKSFIGLTSHEVKERQKQYGKNIISSESSASLIKIFISQFPSLINGILVIAAVFSFLINNVLDAIFILTIIFINGLLGFIQEFRAAKSMEKLKDYTAPVCRVIRESTEEEILAENLVPDDIVVLSEGFKVPADGTLIESTHLEIDESILTGESLPVMKNLSENVFLGTLVTKGKGIFQVEKTAMQTRFGQIANTLSSIQSDKTPLQKNLDELGKLLSLLAIIIGGLIIPIGLYHGELFLPLVLVAASIGVAAIPEGLPAVVAMSFAVGAYRMANQGAIIRKMSAIETLGAVQVILSDKTGTITQNKMRVKKHWLAHHEKLPMLLRACVLGNTASLVEKGSSGKSYEAIGDQTDGALLIWAKEQDIKPELTDSGETIDEFTFDPEYKTITTVWKKESHKYVFVRGAPEAILEKSILTEAEKAHIQMKNEEFANDGLRIIAFAYKTENSSGKLERDQLENNLIFLGIAGIYDPPRPEVKEAIRKSKEAGIHVIMVTGDNELTAISLARETGLIEKDEDVITGDELAKISDDDLAKIILKTRIFARTQPEEKLRLVSVLKKSGIVVGVTGDGVNDALALKKGDVGVAMGKGGTDVAKEASDIVLTDDNFATLIKAIEEGRVIYKNISTAVVYLISGNLAEISLVFFANLFHLPFVLLPTQILWINLVTDSLPALALATGSRDSTVLRNKPRDPQAPILNGKKLLFIFVFGFSLAGFLLALFAYLIQFTQLASARAAIFDLLIYFHLLYIIALGWQSLKRGNTFLLFSVILIFILQVIISTFPFFQNIFHL